LCVSAASPFVNFKSLAESLDPGSSFSSPPQGYETSAITLSVILLMIAMHKDVQKKIYEEIDANYKGGDVEMEELHKYKYIDMVIKESLRLYPALPFIPRKVTREFQMKEYTIPKDTILINFLYHMHRNKLYWGEDAKDFRPERFEPEEIKKIHPHAYAPFACEFFLLIQLSSKQRKCR
jgi:cytochrome P450